MESSVALSKVKIYKLDDNNTYFEVKINPESFKFSRKVRYTEDKVLGTSSNVNRFDGHAPSSLSFNFILDSTGIAYTKTEKIQDTVKKMEKVIYSYNGDIHEPNALKVSWGNFHFNCRVDSLDYDYTLFAPNGEPLRVKVSISFINYITRKQETKESDKKSPDLSRIVTLKAGETIPFWCNEIYGDPSYCLDIARYNGLSGFRDIEPGTSLMFPPLARI